MKQLITTTAWLTVLFLLPLGCGGDDGEDTSTDGEGGAPPIDLNWVSLKGDTFEMGNDDGPSKEAPAHEVDIPSFSITKTEVTAIEFAECVAAEACSGDNYETRDDLSWCNLEHPDRGEHPMNCVNWKGAKEFCEWAGGRLPTEAEWEYAAKSEGEDNDFPWGDDDADCDLANFDEGDGRGCGDDETSEVCDKDGKTDQGLCDMAGNVAEWIEDDYVDGYDDAPDDGSAVEDGDADQKVVRGGSWGDENDGMLRTIRRSSMDPDAIEMTMGFRCVR